MEISLGEMLSAALGGCPEDGFAPPTPSPFNPYQLCQANFRQPNRNYNPPGSCAFNVGLQSHNSAPARVAIPEKQPTTGVVTAAAAEIAGHAQAKTKGRTKNSRNNTTTPPVKKRVRNKIPNPDEWQVNIRKKACAEGKEYISRRGKKVGPKVVINLKNCLANCQYRCAKHVSEEKRKEINRAYYSLKNQTQKRDFLIHTTVRCLTKRPKNFNPRPKGRPPKDEKKAQERRERMAARKERREKREKAKKEKEKLKKQKAKAKKEKLKRGRKRTRASKAKRRRRDSTEEEEEEEEELDFDELDKDKEEEAAKKDKDKNEKDKNDKNKKDKNEKDKNDKDNESATESATDASAKTNLPTDSSKSDPTNDSNQANTPNDLSKTSMPNDLSKTNMPTDSNSNPLTELNKNNPLNVSNMNNSLNGTGQNKAPNELIQNNPYDLHKNHPFSDMPQTNPFDLHRNPFDLHRNPFDLHRNHPFSDLNRNIPFNDPNRNIPFNDPNKNIPFNDPNRNNSNNIEANTNNEADKNNTNNDLNTNTNNESNTNTTNNEADKNNTSNEANTSEASKTTEAPPPVERKSRRKYTFKYYFYVNEQRVQVCKAFYLGTLNISQSPIYSAHETKNPITNTANEDMRGKNPSCRRKPEGNKDYAREHIRSFPTVKSHCCVASKKMKYLDGHLSVAKMYDLYLQKCIETRMDPVKKSMYHHIFSTEFNLSFLKPPSSKSHKCHS
ncbi:hypothetical protein JTE90_009195 [Oedothorax gibbosus]|uniref:Uncharacterized protein n=1 Tax=Oedothorax gibbosus TaxID=931172 RepID=A0AAV6UY76_9ARAC|nr:hypothetical protein JTE90_009195 [Oedothorax gibbosus]